MFDCVRGYIRLGQDFVPAGQPQGWLYGWLGLNPRIYIYIYIYSTMSSTQCTQKPVAPERGVSSERVVSNRTCCTGTLVSGVPVRMSSEGSFLSRIPSEDIRTGTLVSGVTVPMSSESILERKVPSEDIRTGIPETRVPVQHVWYETIFSDETNFSGAIGLQPFHLGLSTQHTDSAHRARSSPLGPGDG